MQPMPLCPAPSLLMGTSVWATFLQVIVVRCIFWCVFFFFFFWLCCPLRFQSSLLKHLWEGFLLCGNFSSFMTPFSGQVSIPTAFVSLFVFCMMSFILSKRTGCLSGCLVSSASVQKLFCGSFSAFKWSLDEFVGEKVVSPSYSSTIFGLPPKVI